jgi:cullin 3
LHQAEAHYEAEAGKLLLTCGALEYLRKVNLMYFVPSFTFLTLRSSFQVQTCIVEEEARVHQLLPSQTLAPVRFILEGILLTPHWQTLIDMASPGLGAMVHHDKLDDLSLQFSLVPVEVSFLCRFLKSSIQKRGTELNRTSVERQELVDSDAHVGNEVDTPTRANASAKSRTQNVSPRGLTLLVALHWVDRVLQLKDKFDRIWEVSFKKDPKIEIALHEVIIIVPFLVIHVMLT